MRYRQTRPQKNQIAAVTHTGEVLTQRLYTVATRRSHLHVETACQWFSQNPSLRKSRYRTGLLTRCEIVSKRCLLVLNLQKPTAAKALQMHRLSGFAFEKITLQNFKKKMYKANASVNRNRVNTIKQLISSKLAMKMQGERLSSKGGVLLVQTVRYVNAWNYSKEYTYSVLFCIEFSWN